MRQALTRILRSRWVLIGAGLLAAYAVCGFFLLPYLVERYVPHYAHETLKRQASIGKVRINPFLLTFEAHDFRLAERNGSPIVSAQRLYLDLEASSLLRWAWVFADIAIDGLDVHVVTGPAGQVNLVDLVAAMRASKPAAPASNRAPVRMVLKHVELRNGRLTYTDLSDPTAASATLVPIDLRLDDVSTLPQRQGQYSIRATLPGGGTMRWGGKVSLQPVASEGELAISRFRPASIWKFLQDEFRLDPPDGTVDFKTSYSFNLAGGRPQLLLRGANLRIAGLALRKPGEAQPLLALQKIEASNIGVDLQRREVTLPRLDISKGRVTGSKAADGTIDWQGIAIARKGPGTAVPPAHIANTSPWRAKFDAVRVADVSARFTDQSRTTPLTLDIGDVAIQGNAQLEVGGATSSVTSNALRIGLAKIALRRSSDSSPLVALDSVTLTGDTIDTAKRDIALRELAVRGGSASLTRDAQGNIDLLAALGTSGQSAARTDAGKTAQAPGAESAPWRLHLDTFKLGDFRIALADRSFKPAIRYDLADVSATLKNLSSDLRAPVPFDAALRVAQGGDVSVAGSLVPDGSGVDARVKLTRLNLVPLQPLVAHYASVNLKSGDLSADATLRYRASKSAPTLRAEGSLGVAGLLVTEEQGGSDLLSCKALDAQGISFGLAPNRLTVREIRLVQPTAKLIVFKDHSFNLANLIKKQAASGAGGAATRGAFPVTVGRVRIQNGTVEYADSSLVLPFTAHIRQLGGVVTGLSSDPSSHAELKLEGRVDAYGSAKADGALSPFAPKKFTDLRVVFRNVNMPTLSPYSATFAGRKIASGRLSLDLEYKIKDGKLLGENKILLDKFTLGKRVESPNALHLPLDLAIALLTDSQGRIDVAVPVQGDVNNPQFSYGHLVWQAIVTVIKKIVTAPFRALGALLGGGAQQLDSIAFDPGSTRVLPPQLEKLKKVAEALQKRPQLKVIVDGRYDVAIDGKALRAEKVRRELAASQGVKLGPGEEPGLVAFDSAKTQLALEKLMRARAGDRAMPEFQAQFEKRAARKVSRVNRALALFGKGSSDRQFYEALYQRLVELQPLDAAALEALAQHRASAVMQALVKDAGVDPARVAAGKTEAVSETGRDSVDTRLRLDVGSAAS